MEYDMRDTTTIQVTKKFALELEKRKAKAETYEELLKRLIKERR